MGQGQEELARQLISEYVVSGSWLLFQNCHLCLPFCAEIVDYVGENSQVNSDFRLWITTEPHKEFPIGLLHASIKFTNEAPQGIKSSLRRTYQSINQVKAFLNPTIFLIKEFIDKFRTTWNTLRANFGQYCCTLCHFYTLWFRYVDS